LKERNPTDEKPASDRTSPGHLGRGFLFVVTLKKSFSDAHNYDHRRNRNDWNCIEQIAAAARLRCDHPVQEPIGNSIGIQAKKRWTRKRKEAILISRTRSSECLFKCLSEQPNKVRSVISASAIGWYGPDKGISFTEEDPAFDDFLGNTCKAWEESIEQVQSLGIRLVKFRLGIALSNEGGALTEFKKPVRAGVAAILGTGEQVVSWIHIDDLCRAFVHAIETAAMSGAYNLVAPMPTTNKNLTVGIARSMNGNLYIPVHVPSFLIKLMLGEMSIEVLKSTTVDSSKLQQTGFNFIYTNIGSALKHLIG